MNIIQIQDRLKGMPKEAIINYVQNPTGEVPSFLALSELQRRKDSEEKFQAMQEQPASIAEQLVTENMPMGIGNMVAQNQPAPPQTGMGAPQPQPEITPEMMASSGVGALPAGNVGQNYAGGGIIAFEEGGEVDEKEIRDKAIKKGENPVYEDGSEGYVLGGLMGVGRAGLGYLNRLLGRTFSSKMPGSTGTSLATTGLKGQVTNDVAKYGPSIFRKYPKTSLAGAGLGAYSLMNGDSDDGSTTEQAAVDQPTAPDTGVETTDDRLRFNPPEFDTTGLTYDDPKAYGKERAAAFKEFIGEDTVTPKLETRLAELESKAERRREDAPYMALARAGLSMAAGDSPFALQNIAKGGVEGLQSYADELNTIDSLDQKIFALDSEIQRAKRAEDVAIATKGFDSMEAAENRNYQVQLEKERRKLENAKTQFAADVELRGKEISATAYGYNIKSEAQILQYAKEMGIGKLYTERENYERMKDGPEKQKALARVNERIGVMMQEAREAVLGRSARSPRTQSGQPVNPGTTAGGQPVYSTDF
jgi:hypothetical protein